MTKLKTLKDFVGNDSTALIQVGLLKAEAVKWIKFARKEIKYWEGENDIEYEEGFIEAFKRFFNIKESDLEEKR